MDSRPSISFKELCEKIEAVPVHADDGLVLTGAAPLETAQAYQVSFLSNPKYAKEALLTRAGALITEKELPDLACAQLVVRNAYLAWAGTCEIFAPDRVPYLKAGIHPTAVLEADVKLGPDVHVGPRVVIGAQTVIGKSSRIHAGVIIEEKCVIGENVEIHPNVVVHYETRIGDRCILWSGTVLGSYGFGYAQDGPKFVRIPQLGRVILEDDVDVGANTAIDRGASGDTIIRRGVKIDNLVHLAHNIEIGEDSAIAAQTGMAGTCKLGKRVKVAGQVGIIGHIEIGDDSFIGAKAGVSKSFPAKSNITGYPARPILEVRRSDVAFSNLPELARRVAALEKNAITKKEP
jgi:UDP-3-O-[3-hydroxymyristoyl] glucosamine N-acyltransferase